MMIISLIQGFGVFIAAILFIILGLYWLVRPSNRVDSNLPGPTKNKWFGVTFDGDFDDLGGKFSWSTWPTFSLLLSRKFNFVTWGGPTLNIGFGPAFFNIVSPACLQYILRDNFDNYVKGRVAKMCLREIFGTGVFTADGTAWRFHRKIVTTLMSKKMVKEGAVRMHAKLQQLEAFLEEKGNEIFDWQTLCYRLFMDVFTEMVFGVELNSLQNETKCDAFLEAFNEIQFLCHQRFADLFWELRQFLCIDKRERRIRECAKILDDFAYQIIEEARSSPNDEEKRDVISQYLHHAKNLHETPPSDKELRDVVMNFLIAGRDTTACGLSWTMFEIIRHPKVGEKIREESKLVCGSSDDAVFTPDTIGKLSYTHAVVMEALRLHPPVPDDFKFAVNDDTLPDGTHIPAGSCVMYSPYSINRNDGVWGKDERYDVDEFWPERFLNRPEPSSFSYPTFNAGPRLCPGKPLALLEIKMALAFLLPRFEFMDSGSPGSEHSGGYTWTLVMSMKNGFPVRVRRRCDD